MTASPTNVGTYGCEGSPGRPGSVDYIFDPCWIPDVPSYGYGYGRRLGDGSEYDDKYYGYADERPLLS